MKLLSFQEGKKPFSTVAEALGGHGNLSPTAERCLPPGRSGATSHTQATVGALGRFPGAFDMPAWRFKV